MNAGRRTARRSCGASCRWPGTSRAVIVADNEREDLDQVAALGLIKAIDRTTLPGGSPSARSPCPRSWASCGAISAIVDGWSVCPRALQELSRELDDTAETLTRELGRTPTVDELAARCGVSAEHVVEARSLATAHRPISLDRPVNDADETETVGSLVGHVDPGYARAEAAVDLALPARASPRA